MTKVQCFDLFVFSITPLHCNVTASLRKSRKDKQIRTLEPFGKQRPAIFRIQWGWKQTNRKECVWSTNVNYSLHSHFISKNCQYSCIQYVSTCNKCHLCMIAVMGNSTYIKLVEKFLDLAKIFCSQNPKIQPQTFFDLPWPQKRYCQTFWKQPQIKAFLHTPARTLSISGLKSRVLKLPFLA